MAKKSKKEPKKVKRKAVPAKEKATVSDVREERAPDVALGNKIAEIAAGVASGKCQGLFVIQFLADGQPAMSWAGRYNTNILYRSLGFAQHFFDVQEMNTLRDAQIAAQAAAQAAAESGSEGASAPQ